ncbi:DUF6252 family protein [Marinirhabdus gelatinilytica]|uniref:Uncharacterized protein n=1 Tax=Marinirhabdus gelatinilytica TaxID=1703343 RepID=A0A370QLI3_9FLAO|nr:DUF6252 family protein [Marinirhabdus gelatinilytica]RDK89234.1 hypothetical protein C8D94_1011115 [Marinirhabdus gelatinilytica]
MKTLKKLTFLLFVSLAVMACNKSDDDGGDDPQGGVGSFTAQVDGSSFTGITGTVVAQLSNNGTALAVSGGTNDSENLQIILTAFDGVGTYQLGLTNIGSYAFLPDPSNPDPSTVVTYTTVNGTSSNGEINISSFDGDTVAGTFSFTAFNPQNTSESVEVTNGEFNIEVTNQ